MYLIGVAIKSNKMYESPSKKLTILNNLIMCLKISNYTYR